MKRFFSLVIAVVIVVLFLLSGSLGSATTVSAQNPTPQLGRVVVKVEKANLRDGPGLNFFLAGQAIKGKKYTYISTTTNADGGIWHEVVVPGLGYKWIADSNVDISSETSRATSLPTPTRFPPTLVPVATQVKK